MASLGERLRKQPRKDKPRTKPKKSPPIIEVGKRGWSIFDMVTDWVVDAWLDGERKKVFRFFALQDGLAWGMAMLIFEATLKSRVGAKFDAIWMDFKNALSKEVG